MKKNHVSLLAKALTISSLLFLFLVSSGRVTAAMWSLNPGSTGIPGIFFDLHAATEAAADSLGLGGVCTTGQRLQRSDLIPTISVQNDVRKILSQRFNDGNLQVGNVSGSDSFIVSGPSTFVNRGTQIGRLCTSSSHPGFNNVANIANPKVISIGGVTGAVLPVVLQGTQSHLPEMSALFPILGLILAVSLTELLRRRRIAQSRSSSR